MLKFATEAPFGTGKVETVLRKEIPKNYQWPRNVRELEQCVRRILLKHNYKTYTVATHSNDVSGKLTDGIKYGNMSAQEVLASYCQIIYAKSGMYEEVARRTKLDRRTVKKYLNLK